MRILGYVLLLAGFAGLMAPHLGLVQDAISIAYERSSRLPDKDSYTKQELADVVTGAALSVARGAPSGVVPGLMMLAGGVLVDEARRRALRKMAAELRATPNGGPAQPPANSNAGGGPPSVS